MIYHENFLIPYLNDFSKKKYEEKIFFKCISFIFCQNLFENKCQLGLFHEFSTGLYSFFVRHRIKNVSNSKKKGKVFSLVFHMSVVETFKDTCTVLV